MIRVNLLPQRVSRRQEAVRQELILAGIGAVLLVVVLGGLHVAHAARVNAVRAKNAEISADIERKKEIVAEVDDMEKLKAEYERKLSVIRKLKANKTGPVHMLDELSQATPEKLQLLNLSEKGGRVELTGIAVSNEVISQFLSNLEQSTYFEDVYLNAIDQTEKEGVKLKNFSITARLVVPGGDRPPSDGAGADAKKKK